MQTSVTKKTLLLSLLLLVTGSAWAEWVKINETHEATYYLDLSTIRKDGNLRKVWAITDLKQRDTDGYMSRRDRTEYDCNGERSKGLSLSTHCESMAGGKTIASHGEDPSGWREIPPDTVARFILKSVCAH